MRAFLAALALACVLFPSPALAAETTMRVAQMARDVTHAVRKKRQQRREQARADDRTTREGKR